MTLRVQGLGETRQIVRDHSRPTSAGARAATRTPPTQPARVNRAPARIALHAWAAQCRRAGVGMDASRRRTTDGAMRVWSPARCILLVDTSVRPASDPRDARRDEAITDDAPITDAVITHSNGDHTHGNQLLARSVRIIAAKGTAEEVAHGMAPEMLAMTQVADLGPVATPYARDRFGPLRLQRHHPAQRRPDFRPRARPRRRRQAGGPAEPRSGAHRRGLRGARARRGRAVRRRPAVHRLHADRVGRPDRRTGSPRATR